MSIRSYCPDGECPSLGVDAASLEGFADVSTGEGEVLVYDVDNEDAWVQSELSFARSACV